MNKIQSIKLGYSYRNFKKKSVNTFTKCTIPIVIGTADERPVSDRKSYIYINIVRWNNRRDRIIKIKHSKQTLTNL